MKKFDLWKYEKFFARDNKHDILLIDPEILKPKYRKEIGSKNFWTMMKIFSGDASEKEIRELETGVTEYAKMRNYFNKNYKTIRLRILARDGEFCRQCQKETDLQIDHIHPLSRGGGNDDDNLQVLCSTCNKVKGAKI